jgi:hypothetical protein
VEREKAAREMEKEAVSAGFYETGGFKAPRIQVLTAAQIIHGDRPKVPFGFTESLKKAATEKGEKKQPTPITPGIARKP